MLDQTIYNEVKKLEIETRHIISSALAGEYQSAFKGRGIEFEEVRPYTEGDEIRFIDWNVTAKLNEPYVKVFREERELQVFLLVDLSSSLFFGTAVETKKDLALKISALLSLVSMKNNDRVGLILFNDQVEKIIPPRKGRKHVLRLISELLSFKPQPRATNLGLALQTLNMVVKKKAVVFIISDFLADNYQEDFKIVARKHDIVPIVIRDNYEKEIKQGRYLRVKDLESQEELVIDTADEKFLENYRDYYQQQYQKVRKYFLQNKTDIVQLTTGEPYLEKLANFFKRRIRRRVC